MAVENEKRSYSVQNRRRKLESWRMLEKGERERAKSAEIFRNCFIRCIICSLAEFIRLHAEDDKKFAEKII